MSNYETRIVDVVAFDMNLRPRDMHRGQIVRIATGKVAYETKCYGERRTARLQAARYLKNFEHHLAKHGIGFEEQQEQKKAAERAARYAKREVDRRLRAAAPDLLAALEDLMRLNRTQGVTSEEFEAACEAADEAINKAKGE